MRDMKFKLRDWVVCVASNSLTRGEGKVIFLPPRIIDVLAYFAKHSNDVVSRQELIDNVWDREIVTDQAVNQAIFLLRKALKDGRSNEEVADYIMTIPKRGYKLLDQVEWLSEKSEESRSEELKDTPQEAKTVVNVEAVTPEKSDHSKIWSFFNELAESCAGFKKSVY